jgi:glycosyltransferase involved in cell wall biosynthesis
MNMDLQQIKAAALAKVNAGDATAAAAMFRQVLQIAPNDVDCLHMMGELFFRSGQMREAVHFFSAAGVSANWTIPATTQKFGLSLSNIYGAEFTVRRIAYLAWLNARRRRAKPVSPLVTVIVPSYNHGQFIAQCLESIYRQTWEKIEVIVIDDGSTDDSVERIRERLITCPFPHQFIVRENRGAAQTINEAVALASGDYINILNSDDRFHAERIEKMVLHVSAIDADWGFAGIEVIDDEGKIASSAKDSLPMKLRDISSSTPIAPSVGFALLANNVAVSTGNLFIRATFLRKMGGFSDLRYVHDLEFALRATLHSEPVYVAEPLYEYRVHHNNTISESGPRANVETGTMLKKHIQKIFSADTVANPFAPSYGIWREHITIYLLRRGFDELLSPEQLTNTAQHVENKMNQAHANVAALLGGIEGIAAARPLFTAMLTQPHGVQATFDQFQRYGIIARAIEYLRAHLQTAGQSFSILEVGANTHRLLGKLLPHDKITYLDREIPLEMQGASDVILGDATDLNMADKSFDIVIALDVFEHIAPPQRNDFLRHIARVSRFATMLAAPFNSAAVCEAENDACAYWDSLFAEPYRWLTEHAENGLPDFLQTTQHIAELGMSHVHFSHGNLALWREMLKAHFAAVSLPDLRAPSVSMDGFYRDHLLACDTGDTGDDETYRQFLFFSTGKSVMSQLADFSASLEASGNFPDTAPIMDVLRAMQQLALVRKRSTVSANASIGAPLQQ